MYTCLLFNNAIMNLSYGNKKHQHVRCVSYLLLCNKLPQSLAAWNNTHGLPHSFCGSGIQALLSLSSLRVSWKAVIKVSAGAALIQSLGCEKIWVQAHLCGVGRIKSSWTFGRRSLASHWWLSRSHPQNLAR